MNDKTSRVISWKGHGQFGADLLKKASVDVNMHYSQQRVLSNQSTSHAGPMPRVITHHIVVSVETFLLTFGAQDDCDCKLSLSLISFMVTTLRPVLHFSTKKLYSKKDDSRRSTAAAKVSGRQYFLME
jgi:hypothetical protein